VALDISISLDELFALGKKILKIINKTLANFLDKNFANLIFVFP
tara:strand:- start:862 stop:993 length:132 start_codon:yes stop_codon:yes gene_type:complete